MNPGFEERVQFMRLTLGGLAAVYLLFFLRGLRAPVWRRLQEFVFSVPLSALVVVIAYKLAFGVKDARYISFIREDGPVEYATAAVFLVTSLVALRACFVAPEWQSRTFLGLLSLGALFISLSEVSFGQRLIGLETPETLLAVNRQKEISIHNIYGIEWLVYQVMPLIIFAYALFSRGVAAWLATSAYRRLLSRELLTVAPAPWYSVTYFLPMALYCVKSWTVANHVWQDQEPSELFLAIGFLMVALQAWWVLAAARAEPAVGAPRQVTGRRP